MPSLPLLDHREPADPAAVILERLQRLHPKVIDLSLERVERLLAALGYPQRRLAPVVHVAGTNGKGSTLAFLRAMLEAAGYRVHVYTSPHLVHFRERIRLAGPAGGPAGGRFIDDAHLSALLARCEAVNNGQPITFFEITTAAALLAFAETPADVVLLETGLGGRLDATNVIERPAVTAITRLSYDHMSFLGPTLSAIAGEKAGILKPGVPLVLAPQPAAEAQETVVAVARALGVPILDWRVEPLAGGSFRYESPARRLELPPPALLGCHQLINAGTALACLDALAPLRPVAEAAVRRGLATVEWPARLQRLSRGPLVARLPAGWQLWLDGGHNDSAGEALAVQAAAWAGEPSPLPLVLIFGMLGTKQPTAFLAPLAATTQRLYAVAIPGEHATLSAEAIAEAAHATISAKVDTAPTVAAALAAAITTAAGPCRVLICGSLYLAGSVLAENG